MVKSNESVSIEIERSLKKIFSRQEFSSIKLVTHPHVDHFLSGADKQFFLKLASESNIALVFETNDSLHLNDWHFYSNQTNRRIEV